MFIKDSLSRTDKVFRDRVGAANQSFNRLPKQKQKTIVVVFGICVTIISVFLILQDPRDSGSKTGIKPDKISTPYDIFMENESRVTDNQLTPVGKMKGEIDEEFESFYVAVDNKGTVYINREIEYSERAYRKTEDWKQISKEKLMEYERELHFIPLGGKGLRR